MISNNIKRRCANVEIRTRGGPEAFRRLYQQILQQTGVSVTQQLRSNQREDRQTGILKMHCINTGLYAILRAGFLTSFLL